MDRKTVSGIMLTTLLVGTLTLAFGIQQPRAFEYIFILSYGPVDPPTAPIQWDGGIYYTFTDNIYGKQIVVWRPGIIIDGADHVLDGPGAGGPTAGIALADKFTREKVTIKNLEIRSFDYGIWADLQNNISVSGCTFENNNYGIWLKGSSSNNISDNIMTKNQWASICLELSQCHNNTIYNNTITFSEYGIKLVNSSYNTISENIIENNHENGVGVLYSANNTISGNTLTGHTAPGPSCGIRLDRSQENTISGNTITKNRYAVWLNSSLENTISGNTIAESWYRGIYLSNSSGNTISENPITANYCKGIYLSNSSNNSISRNPITNNEDYGIYLLNSTRNDIFGNDIVNNPVGIRLGWSHNSTVFGNTIAENNEEGIYLSNSSNNWINGNTIAYNELGIKFDNASDNSVYHNDFISNTLQATSDTMNSWDNSTLERGNYWSNYDGVDESGDGKVGDEPYIVDINNQDNYPLIIPRGPFPVFLKDVRYDCRIIGNATVSNMCFVKSDNCMEFNVTISSFDGWWNLTIPRLLLDEQFKVKIDDAGIPAMLSWNYTHTSVSFTYGGEGAHHVEVIANMPIKEFPDIIKNGVIDIFDVVTIAKHFGKTLEG